MAKIATSYMGENIRFDLYQGSFSDIEYSKVNQVYGIISNSQSQLLLVFQTSNIFLLPGGQIETGETYLETLNREAYEEAAVTLIPDSIKEAFYQEAWKLKDGQWELDCIQLRYSAKVDRVDNWSIDGDLTKQGSIVGQKWVAKSELDNYLKWGESNEIIKKFF